MKQLNPATTAGAFIRNEKGELFLIRSPSWMNKFCVPGGHIEVGESIAETVERETKEETNLDIKFENVFTVLDGIFPKDFHKKKHFIFINCVCKKIGGEVKLDRKEATEFIWVSLEKALELELEEVIRKAIEYLKENEERVWQEK